MKSDLDKLLRKLLKLALTNADRIPTPDAPPTAAQERAADDWCLQFAEQTPPPLTPEIAAALIPRLRAARQMAGSVAHLLNLPCRVTGDAASEREILATLLVYLWRDLYRELWLAGKLE